MADGTLPIAHHASMLPANLNEAATMADYIARSGLFGCSTKEQAFALMLLADAEGMHPAIAARDYHIIQGRPSLRADAMLARFQNAGGKVEWLERSDEKVSARFSHPSGGELTVTWTFEMAKKIGLTGKDGWKKYPRQMLTARVASEGVRTVFPGVVSGLYTPEEVQDFDNRKDEIVVEKPADEPDLSNAGRPAPPERRPKKDARDLYSDLQTGLRETNSMEDQTYWYKANANAIRSLPKDWEDNLVAEMRERADNYRAASKEHDEIPV